MPLCHFSAIFAPFLRHFCAIFAPFLRHFRAKNIMSDVLE
jgi:hypothetical protein